MEEKEIFQGNNNKQAFCERLILVLTKADSSEQKKDQINNIRKTSIYIYWYILYEPPSMFIQDMVQYTIYLHSPLCTMPSY